MIIYCFLLDDFHLTEEQRNLENKRNFCILSFLLVSYPKLHLFTSDNCFFSAPNEDNFSTWKKKQAQQQPHSPPLEFKSLLDFLSHYKLAKYEKQFMEHGYDDIDFVGEDVINDADLARLGINDRQDQLILMEAFKKKGYSQGNNMLPSCLLIELQDHFGFPVIHTIRVDRQPQ